MAKISELERSFVSRGMPIILYGDTFGVENVVGPIFGVSCVINYIGIKDSDDIKDEEIERNKNIVFAVHELSSDFLNNMKDDNKAKDIALSKAMERLCWKLFPKKVSPNVFLTKEEIHEVVSRDDVVSPTVDQFYQLDNSPTLTALSQNANFMVLPKETVPLVAYFCNRIGKMVYNRYMEGFKKAYPMFKDIDNFSNVCKLHRSILKDNGFTPEHRKYKIRIKKTTKGSVIISNSEKRNVLEVPVNSQESIIKLFNDMNNQ